MDLVTLSVAFGASKKYTDSLGSGITNIQVSPDGTSLIFTTTNGSTFTISIEDWNAITAAEKEKLDKIIISGNGELFLSNDGVYKLPSGGDSNYNSLENKPSINGNQLLGNKSGIDLGFSTVATTGSYSDLSNKPTIPTLVSQLSNDSGFVLSTVDNLVNYYLKSDTYTKVEVNGLIGNIASIDVQIVTVLPTENISLTTIYLIQIPETTNYNQWMYINSIWANIGSTSVDLSNYYNKTEIDTLLNGKVDKITGYGLSQENFTTAQKDKLAGLNNYTPPIATETTLGQVMVDGVSIYIDENGVISAATGGGGLAPSNVSNINLIAGNGQIVISWKDPEDTIVDGVTLSKWKGTKLVQKIGGYPLSPTDGTIIVDNQIRNNYETNGIIISPLTNDTTYYYQLFPYSEEGVTNRNILNRAEGTPTEVTFKTMTVIIDTTNSNPETALTYADDALTMTPGSDEWDEWFGIYPCLFKDGVEVGKLNPNNFSQFEDGTPADITSGSAGDVMIAFPRKGLKIETIGTDIYVKMTDNPSDENFEYNAHRRDTTQKDKFYIGAYEGSILSTKMRSLSNKQIGTSYTTNHVINEYRTYCNNNGYGYDMFSFYQLIFIQSMYILKYKNLNSQNTIGIGRLSTFSNTGTTDTNGMNYGSITNNTISVKLFGIEDLWGNAYDFIDGVKISSAGYILTSTINFNDIGNGYNQYEKLTTTNRSGYLNVATGTTEMGFAPKNFNGSATTYFCDNCFINLNTVLKFGGSQGDGNGAGIFCSYFSLLSSGKDIFTQTRLMYL